MVWKTCQKKNTHRCKINTFWRHNILAKLNQILCKGKTHNLITNFLKDCIFEVKANNHLSEEFIQENGVSKGSAHL